MQSHNQWQWRDCFVLLFLKGPLSFSPRPKKIKKVYYFQNQHCKSEQNRSVEQTWLSSPVRDFKALEWPIRQGPLSWKQQLKSVWRLDLYFFFWSVCLPYSFKIIKTPTPWNSKKRVKFKVGFIQLNGCQRRLLGEILSLCESPELGIGYKNGPGASSKVEMSNQMTRFYWVPFFSGKDSFHFNHFVSQLCAKSPGW